MKRTKLFSCVLINTVLSICGTTAFDWPVKNFDGNKILSTFAQNRKQHFNASLVFPEAQEVIATDKGKVKLVILEHQGECNWFESTLGNCIIMEHEGNLISVYGNLEKSGAEDALQKERFFSRENVGSAENSAWNESAGALEFQVADTKGKAFLNPLIFMPKLSSESPLLIDDITIENKLGRSYELSSLKSVQAGTYKVYKRRRENSPLQSSSIYVNGTELERIDRDALYQENNLLALSGQRAYDSVNFFPDEAREFLGQILLLHGNNSIAIVIRNVMENERTVLFTVQAY